MLNAIDSIGFVLFRSEMIPENVRCKLSSIVLLLRLECLNLGGKENRYERWAKCMCLRSRDVYDTINRKTRDRNSDTHTRDRENRETDVMIFPDGHRTRW